MPWNVVRSVGRREPGKKGGTNGNVVGETTGKYSKKKMVMEKKKRPGQDIGKTNSQRKGGYRWGEKSRNENALAQREVGQRKIPHLGRGGTVGFWKKSVSWTRELRWRSQAWYV